VETILANALGEGAARSAAAEKRDLLARLLARVAHEIRNPLSSLDIHVQLLEEDLGALAPDTRSQLTPRLEIIQGELHRLESIVSQFVRLTGPSDLDLEPVRISRVVNHVCELLRPEAAAREVEIRAPSGDEPPEIRADSVRLTQALLNLVINALQAVDRQGWIGVEVALEGEWLSVAVRDNGPGIAAEKLASIFDPYYTTKAEGHGLGLWIAQQIVIGHGGTLSAQNAPDGGALFTMRLPLTPRKEDAPRNG
jgi:two-component system sensor histidine kinase HydH